MQLDKNTWHYRVWAWTHAGSPPVATNLCSYVQRIIWLPILYYIFRGLFYTLVPAFFYLVATPIGLLFGYRPNPLSAIDPLGLDFEYKRGVTVPEPMVPYTLFKIGLFEVKTWHFLIAGGIGFIQWIMCYLNGTRHVLTIEGGIIGAVVAIVGGFIIHCWLCDAADGTGQIVKAWFRAKKDGICPLVTFTDGKVQNENDSTK